MCLIFVRHVCTKLLKPLCMIFLGAVLEGFADECHRYANPFDTELHHAVRTGDLVAVKRLLKDGASVAVHGAYNNYPLYLAAEHNNAELAKVLLDDKNCFYDTHHKHGIFFLSINYWDPSKAWAHKINYVNANDNGKTPLMIAAKNGNHLVVQCLLDSNATGIDEAFQQTFMGYTPVKTIQYENAIAALLKAGANILVFDCLGKAIEKNASDGLIRLLLKYNVWVRMRTSKKRKIIGYNTRCMRRLMQESPTSSRAA